MHRMDLSPNVGEDDLHAVVDGQLNADRHREVMAYLAVYPDAADRVSAFFRQRVELAALRESLNDSEPGGALEELERALCQKVRQQQRTRRVLGAGGMALALAAAVSGWWVVGNRFPIGEVRTAASSTAESRAFGEMLYTEVAPVAERAGDAAIIWLQAHLTGRTIKQPNLESLGLHLVRAAALKNAVAPAIRLQYADAAATSYDLFIGVPESGVEFAASAVLEGHISLNWKRDPLVFSLVAPQGSARLDEIMRSVDDLLNPSPLAADAGSAEPMATSPNSAGHGNAGGTAAPDAVPSAVGGSEGSKPL
jgi:anti-sigma factor RsiW